MPANWQTKFRNVLFNHRAEDLATRLDKLEAKAIQYERQRAEEAVANRRAQAVRMVQQSGNQLTFNEALGRLQAS